MSDVASLITKMKGGNTSIKRFSTTYASYVSNTVTAPSTRRSPLCRRSATPSRLRSGRRKNKSAGRNISDGASAD